LLEGTDVCFAPVLSMEEAPRHPHLRARQTFVEVDGVHQPAPAPRFSRTPAAQPVAPSEPNLIHAEKALADWLPASEIAHFRATGTFN
jgi:crotonobetainyl-CoA:carnitine CoA-transferase CaiB-like acyl-CoA transferase